MNSRITATRRFTYYAKQPFKLDCQRVDPSYTRWAVVVWPVGEICRN